MAGLRQAALVSNDVVRRQLGEACCDRCQAVAKADMIKALPFAMLEGSSRHAGDSDVATSLAASSIHLDKVAAP